MKRFKGCVPLGHLETKPAKGTPKDPKTQVKGPGDLVMSLQNDFRGDDVSVYR